MWNHFCGIDTLKENYIWIYEIFNHIKTWMQQNCTKIRKRQSGEGDSLGIVQMITNEYSMHKPEALLKMRHIKLNGNLRYKFIAHCRQEDQT